MAARPKLNLTSSELEEAENLARRRGFTDLTAYMRQLIKKDAEQDGKLSSEADEDPLESFKRGWDDAMNGRVMTREEFRRRMSADED